MQHALNLGPLEIQSVTLTLLGQPLQPYAHRTPVLGLLCTVQEAQIEAVLQEMDIDLLVLARYMQIFSEDFCSRHAKHTINIHHSFLPAFEGALSGPSHKVRMLGLMSGSHQRGGADISDPLKV